MMTPKGNVNQIKMCIFKTLLLVNYGFLGKKNVVSFGRFCLPSAGKIK
jgi:hypothetical protein